MVHKAFPGLIQRSAIRIALVGLGGNGALMLTRLARMQVSFREIGHPGFTVDAYDPDIVTHANVGRQAYYASDVGLNKALVAVNRVNMAYGLDWDGYPVRFGTVRDFIHIVVGCVDTAKARREILSICTDGGRLQPYYWLDLGNQATFGQVILGQVRPDLCQEPLMDQPKLRHILEFFPEMADPDYPENDAPSCSLADALSRQDLYMNDALAVHAADILWKLLRYSEISYHGVWVNLATGTVRPQPCPDPPDPEGDNYDAGLRRDQAQRIPEHHHDRDQRPRRRPLRKRPHRAVPGAPGGNPVPRGVHARRRRLALDLERRLHPAGRDRRARPAQPAGI